MYNPKKVIELIEDCGVRKKELLDYMGKNWNGSVEAVIKGDIRVSKLEKIADFFGVPIDTFFDRDPIGNSVNVNGVKNRVQNFSVGADPEGKKHYEALIKEKDSRIADLQDTIKILKRQLGIE